MGIRGLEPAGTVRLLEKEPTPAERYAHAAALLVIATPAKDTNARPANEGTRREPPARGVS
jgi:hypothetical protein